MTATAKSLPREYNLWVSIKQRCTNPKNPLYNNYGAKGVRVCAAWNDSFQQFIIDVGPCPSKHHLLEIGKTERGYSPGNCRWVKRLHGKFGTKVYSAWANMLARCYNPKTAGYAYYGGQGVTVCKRWHTFAHFYEDMGDPPTPFHSLDKKGKVYTKRRCRWATSIEQANNISTNRFITFHGKTQTLAQWAREFKLNYHLVHNRLRIGWSLERTFNTPYVSTIKSLARTPVYKAWDSMMGRCYRPRDPSYARYGAKGIKVAKRWHEFSVFAADMGQPPPHYTLDRKNPRKNYSLRNCRWAPKGVGRMTHERLFTYNGTVMNLAQLARLAGVVNTTIARRLKRGLSVRQAVLAGTRVR